MMLGYEFALAAAYYEETGHGYTLADKDGAFFCGFAQDDGSLVFEHYAQSGQPGRKPIFEKKADSAAFDRSRPVFLKPDEMREQGVAAAVYPFSGDAVRACGIPDQVKSEGRLFEVHKDLTYVPPKKPEKVSFWDALDAIPQSQPGLASPDACENGYDRGYISLRTGIRKTFEALKRGLGLG